MGPLPQQSPTGEGPGVWVKILRTTIPSAGEYLSGRTRRRRPMRLYGKDGRGNSPIGIRASFSSILLIPVLLVCLGLQEPASAQQPGASSPLVNAPLSGEQVVENLVAMNLMRAHALHSYQGTRLYRIEYHGFPGARSAEMVVDIKD